jgi:hypothetical protein
MSPHSDLLGQLAKEHQSQLLREAERERQAMRAREGRPLLSQRLRDRASALLLALSRPNHARTAERARKVRMTQSIG